MSVDKFGRHSQKLKSLKGPKGEGFNVTSEGDYDIKQKRMRFVNDPVDELDAVNFRTVKSKIKKCLRLNDKKVYDANNSIISRVGNAIEDDNVVNVKYVKDKCVMYGAKSIDAKGLTISNIKNPERAKEAVTKEYFDNRSPQVLRYNWNFFNKRLSNVSEPIEKNDVVTIGYLNQKIPSKSENGYDFSNMRLTNLSEPDHSDDAVTLGYLDSNCLSLIDRNSWNVANKQLKNVADPTDMEDGVTLNYLVRMVSEIYYRLYFRFSQETDSIRSFPKEEWIQQNIVHPLFINEATKIRSKPHV